MHAVQQRPAAYMRCSSNCISAGMQPEALSHNSMQQMGHRRRASPAHLRAACNGAAREGQHLAHGAALEEAKGGQVGGQAQQERVLVRPIVLPQLHARQLGLHNVRERCGSGRRQVSGGGGG